MSINPQLMEKIRESLSSVLPITAIVLLLSITIAPLTPGAMVLFFFGALLLIVGTGIFTLGVDMSMTPMGSGMGIYMSQSRRKWLTLGAAFVLGLLVTIAEPDLQVLATQVPAIPNLTLILTVAVGVGLFLVLALVRILLKIPLSRLLAVPGACRCRDCQQLAEEEGPVCDQHPPLLPEGLLPLAAPLR